MARKTKSKIIKTFPIRSDRGDEEYWFGKEKHSVTPLPKELNEPLPINWEVYLDHYFHAAQNPVSLIEFEANYRALLKAKLSERWTALFNAYEMKDDSREAWRRLALDLARDYVPGVSVEHVEPAGPAPRVMKREYIEALITRVRRTMEELKANNRSSRSTKVTESQALKALWKTWPPELGRKRSTLKSFEVHYYQCKAAFRPKTLAELGSDSYKSAGK